MVQERVEKLKNLVSKSWNWLSTTVEMLEFYEYLKHKTLPEQNKTTHLSSRHIRLIQTDPQGTNLQTSQNKSPLLKHRS